MNFISYAQNYEDVILWRALKHVKNGFYVDVGANDPIEDSVTKAFYDKGWRGINIEPVDQSFAFLQKSRPRDINLQVAASNKAGKIKFYEVKGTGLSTTKLEFARRHKAEHEYDVSEYEVKAQPLTDIFFEHKVTEINFLKIDVEGSEYFALKGLDLSIFRPWIILVESTLPNTQRESYGQWESLITNFKYHYVYFDGLNRFYVADEHSELDASFTVPPNYWDAFVTVKEHRLNLQLQQIYTEGLEKQLTYEKEIQEIQKQYRQLKLDHEVILNSRSIKITAPFRQLGSVARKAKGSFEIHAVIRSTVKLIFNQIIRFKEKLDLATAIKRLFSKFLISFILWLKKNKKANKIAKYLLFRIPGLDSKIRHTYSSIVYSLSFQNKRARPTETLSLSSTARQVYTQLKQAIGRYHGDI